MMTPEEIRFEVLRLCNRNDHPAVQVITRAKEYEAFVSGIPAEEIEEPETVGLSKKKGKRTANPDILS